MPLSSDALVVREESLVVPSGPLSELEKGLETLANLLSVELRCGRSIASPVRCVFVFSETADDREVLARCRDIERHNRVLVQTPHAVDWRDLSPHLVDRARGIALLSEAWGHGHQIGRFRDYLRIFELAFGRSGAKLAGPLADFLFESSTKMNRKEIRGWVVDARGAAVHADSGDFLRDRDVWPFIQRVEQAALDVLFNKARWRDASPDRRVAWRPWFAVPSVGADAIIRQHFPGEHLLMELFDDMGSYPRDLTAGRPEVPDGWWPTSFPAEITYKFTTTIVPEAEFTRPFLRAFEDEAVIVGDSN